MTVKHIWTDRWADPKGILDGLTDDCDRYRPHYAVAVLEYARRYMGTVDRLVDLASGTGILTRSLRAVFPGSEIIGAEPGQDMLTESARRTDVEFGIRWMATRAESLSFADDSIDLVAIGQAMHWFDRAIFYQECHRVLRPGDTLAVFYNNRIKGSARSPKGAKRCLNVSRRATGAAIATTTLTAGFGIIPRPRTSSSTGMPGTGVVRCPSSSATSDRRPTTRPRCEPCRRPSCSPSWEHAMAPFAADNGILRVPCETVTILARFG